MEIGGQLQNRTAGQIHIGQRLQKKQLSSGVFCLPVQPLEFGLIDLTAKFLSNQINGTPTGIVPGLFVLPAGITETDDQPVFAFFTKHT